MPKPHGALHDVVEIDRTVQELVDRTAFGRGQRLDLRKAVDEQPVTLVRGDSPGAGVGATM